MMMMHIASASIVAANNPGVVIVWSLSLLGLLVAGYVVIVHVRRRYLQPGDHLPYAGFTLADLRELHRQGKITDEEFAAAKAKVVEAAQLAQAEHAKRQSDADTGASEVGFQQKMRADSTSPDKNEP